MIVALQNYGSKTCLWRCTTVHHGVHISGDIICTYILQEDGPLIVDNDYIAMERTASSDDKDTVAGISVGVAIAIIVVIVVLIIISVSASIWCYR